MKTAISLPDEIFEQAEVLAARLRLSRSALYRNALSEYLLRHDPSELTEAMDRAVAAAGPGVDPFVTETAGLVLQRVEW